MMLSCLTDEQFQEQFYDLNNALQMSLILALMWVYACFFNSEYINVSGQWVLHQLLPSHSRSLVTIVTVLANSLLLFHIIGGCFPG